MNLNTRAKELRKEQTDAERFLWRRLRNRRLNGYKFRRQLTLPPFIVDFVCLEAKLIIELDGAHHLLQSEYDAERTKYLQSQGFAVLRFWNDEVMKNADAVLEVILNKLSMLQPDSAACPSPPAPLPQRGEGSLLIGFDVSHPSPPVGEGPRVRGEAQSKKSAIKPDNSTIQKVKQCKNR